MHCRNTTFAYHNEFKEYMKVGEAVLKDIFDYLFDVKAEKLLSEKGKKYFLELFEKGDPEHLQFDKEFHDNLDNDGLEDIIENEGM